MTTYYLQVLTTNVSIMIDTDINCFHHFQIGDIIKVGMKLDKGPTVNFDCWSITDPQFTLDWDKRSSTKLSIAGCIQRGVMMDISTQIERDKKLKELGL